MKKSELRQLIREEIKEIKDTQNIYRVYVSFSGIDNNLFVKAKDEKEAIQRALKDPELDLDTGAELMDREFIEEMELEEEYNEFKNSSATTLLYDSGT